MASGGCRCHQGDAWCLLALQVVLARPGLEFPCSRFALRLLAGCTSRTGSVEGTMIHLMGFDSSTYPAT
jgi:hypothetical protein